MVEVVSLRLTPPIVRMDLWDPGCWREQSENRKIRREQLREITARLAPDGLGIVGGDFNAPAGDAIFRLLSPGFRDSFAQAGRGWGNTALNEMPVSRVDQIWVSRSFRTAAAVARKTVHSDHRMVISDLSLAK